eukprot:jgi/Chlat1/8862/Chrsp91S00682
MRMEEDDDHHQDDQDDEEEEAIRRFLQPDETLRDLIARSVAGGEGQSAPLTGVPLLDRRLRLRPGRSVLEVAGPAASAKTELLLQVN